MRRLREGFESVLGALPQYSHIFLTADTTVYIGQEYGVNLKSFGILARPRVGNWTLKCYMPAADFLHGHRETKVMKLTSHFFTL
jgi:hypothetical protein